MRKNVSFPEAHLISRINQQAKAEGRSFSGMVNRICQLYFMSKDRNDKKT